MQEVGSRRKLRQAAAPKKQLGSSPAHRGSCHPGSLPPSLANAAAPGRPGSKPPRKSAPAALHPHGHSPDDGQEGEGGQDALGQLALGAPQQRGPLAGGSGAAAIARASHGGRPSCCCSAETLGRRTAAPRRRTCQSALEWLAAASAERASERLRLMRSCLQASTERAAPAPTLPISPRQPGGAAAPAHRPSARPCQTAVPFKA